MRWIPQNWLSLVFAVLFIAMHLFGHGGHRGRGDGPRRSGEEQEEHRGRH